MITKKRLILVLAPLCLCLIGILLFTRFKKDEGPSTSRTFYASNSLKQVVGINGVLGLNIEGTFEGVTSADVESQAYKLLAEQIKDPKEYYEGEIRQNSVVSKDTTNQDATTLSFLIDIPELKRTFKVQIEQGENEEYTTLYVVCPEPSEFKYPAVDCKDIE